MTGKVIAVLSLLALACTSLVDVVNHPPDRPDPPFGPLAPAFDSTCACSARATDPDGDSVALRFDWGDGDTSEWSALAAPGDWVTATHAWPPGDRPVAAQARDARDALSGWSDAHQVTVSGPPEYPDSLLAEVWFPHRLGEPVLSPGGDFIYIPGTRGVYRFPTADLAHPDSVTTGHSGLGAALSADGTRLYVATRGGVDVFYTPTFAFIENIPIDAQDYRSVIAVPGDEYLYVTPERDDSGATAVVRLSDKAVVAHLPWGPEPADEHTHHAFSPDGRHVYIPTPVGLYVISSSDHSVAQLIPAGCYPHSVAALADGTVWLTGDEQLYLLAGSPLALVDSVPLLDPAGGGLAALPGGDILYAAVGSAEARVVDTRRRRVLATLLLGEGAGDDEDSYFFVHPRGDRVFFVDAEHSALVALGLRGRP